MNINIDKLNDEIKAELNAMKENDALYIDEQGKAKYAIMPIKRFDRAEELLELLGDFNSNGPEVKIIGSNEELSYEEYEKIKAVIMEAVDKTFKPKAEKLN